MPTTRKSSKPGGKFKRPPADSSMRKSVRQVSLEIHIGENTISRAIYAGKFPATGTHSSWLIDTTNEDFKKWVASIQSDANYLERREILAKARAARAAHRKEEEESEGQFEPE